MPDMLKSAGQICGGKRLWQIRANALVKTYFRVRPSIVSQAQLVSHVYIRSAKSRFRLSNQDLTRLFFMRCVRHDMSSMTLFVILCGERVCCQKKLHRNHGFPVCLKHTRRQIVVGDLTAQDSQAHMIG